MENKGFYEGEYMPQMHKIGKLTGFLGAVLSFLPEFWSLRKKEEKVYDDGRNFTGSSGIGSLHIRASGIAVSGI